MEQDVIAQTVFVKRIVLVIALVDVPVLVKLLGAENENGLVAVLVILDNRNGGECLTETNGIGKNTSSACLQLIDDGESGILLEVI